MNAALWTKLKAAGAVRSVAEECRRFHFWLPVSWQPLHAMLMRAMDTYRGLESAEERGRFEMEVQAAFEQYLRLHRQILYRDLLHGFVLEVGSLMRRNREFRLQALRGERVQGDLEEEMVRDLRLWLRARGPHCREVTAWLERLLQAWWRARRLGS